MDIGKKPGQSPGKGLRRRVIFELEEAQLPLLEDAERRHGSKRAALIAALEAEASQPAQSNAKGEAKGTRKGAAAPAKLEAELAETTESLEAARAELETLRPAAVDLLYCERCEEWVPPEEWRWVEAGNGAYAYHAPCGREDGDAEGASSWFALRLYS